MNEYWWVYIKDQGPGNYRDRQAQRRVWYGEINSEFPQFTENHFATEFMARKWKSKINRMFPHIPLEVLPGIDG